MGVPLEIMWEERYNKGQGLKDAFGTEKGENAYICK
jgi:hypothetical protein